MRTRLAFWALAAAILGACGGKVAVDGGGGGVTGGGGASAGTSNGGGATAQVCGGKAGIPCAADAWCQWDPQGSCGAFDNTGTCQTKPGGACPPDCPGVCACDGLFYCNACEAHAAGFDVSTNGTCGFGEAGGPDPEYAAYMLPTDVPRYVVTKTEHAADRCVIMTVAAIGGGVFPNIQVTMGWGVEDAFVTPHASDCLPGANGFPLPFPGDGAQAIDGKGSVKQDSAGFPCTVAFDVAFAFEPAPGLPGDDALQSDGLLIQNGGCFP